jgi:GT2 family glycosyltransferase
MNLKEFKTKSGEIILYNGSPNFEKLENLATGSGDIWHSSFEQGYKNAFSDLVYQAAVFYWYLNDFDNLEECVSWRINPHQFAIRKKVWEIIGGFDKDFDNPQMQALDFGFASNRFYAAIPLYCKGLFESNVLDEIIISPKDRHLFFRKNFKIDHAIYMNFRIGFWKISEWNLLFKTKNKFKKRNFHKIIPPRKLNEIHGNPTVSYIIPTMLRQEFTVQLLADLSNQNYLPKEVIVVDATPESERDELLYIPQIYPFELKVIWQKSKGSCRARNEGIAISTGDYIIFADDDIRILPNFIENHIKLLQTYKAGACNGLDIRAYKDTDDLVVLKNAYDNLNEIKKHVGCTQMFSNANSCVERKYVNQLVGNDVNFDGGYGEDSDFGMSLSKIGVTVLYNPFSANLHLKPESGGYRWWGMQAGILGKKRKAQPWELNVPVKNIRPVPSPTIMYGILKHFNVFQLKEYKYKHFIFYIVNGSKIGILYRILRIPYKNLEFKKSIFYANKLIELGKRTK